MPRAFSITVVTDSIRLSQSGEGELSFTVSNALRAPVRARASVVPDPLMKVEWTSIEGEEERDFAPDGTQQVTVKFKVPPGTSPGRYTFHLLVVDVSNPDERYAEGPTCAVEVVAAAPVPTKPFPWQWVALAAGVVVIVIGVTSLIAQHGGTGGGGAPGLLDPCPEGECARDLVCFGADAGVDGGLSDGGVCLGEKGFSPCDGGTQCATGFCPKGSCELALGLACAPNGTCPGPLKCVTVLGSRLCLLQRGEECSSDRDCASFFCRPDGTCNRDDGRCEGPDQCRPPSTCGPTQLCQLPLGQPCNAHEVCLSGFCSGTCQPPPVGFECPFGCPPFSACVGGRCIPVGNVINQQMLQVSPDTVQGIQQLQRQQLQPQ